VERLCERRRGEPRLNRCPIMYAREPANRPTRLWVTGSAKAAAVTVRLAMSSLQTDGRAQTLGWV
jgi:hypothetical protein